MKKFLLIFCVLGVKAPLTVELFGFKNGCKGPAGQVIVNSLNFEKLYGFKNGCGDSACNANMSPEVQACILANEELAMLKIQKSMMCNILGYFVRASFSEFSQRSEAEKQKSSRYCGFCQNMVSTMDAICPGLCGIAAGMASDPDVEGYEVNFNHICWPCHSGHETRKLRIQLLSLDDDKVLKECCLKRDVSKEIEKIRKEIEILSEQIFPNVNVRISFAALQGSKAFVCERLNESSLSKEMKLRFSESWAKSNLEPITIYGGRIAIGSINIQKIDTDCELQA